LFSIAAYQEPAAILQWLDNRLNLYQFVRKADPNDEYPSLEVE